MIEKVFLGADEKSGRSVRSVVQRKLPLPRTYPAKALLIAQSPEKTYRTSSTTPVHLFFISPLILQPLFYSFIHSGKLKTITLKHTQDRLPQCPQS
jgi:hypothetical protein